MDFSINQSLNLLIQCWNITSILWYSLCAVLFAKVLLKKHPSKLHVYVPGRYISPGSHWYRVLTASPWPWKMLSRPYSHVLHNYSPFEPHVTAKTRNGIPSKTNNSFRIQSPCRLLVLLKLSFKEIIHAGCRVEASNRVWQHRWIYATICDMLRKRGTHG